METDCCFTLENNWFRYRAAAIIVEDGCVLLVGNDKEDYLYSVGGGVHMNERAEDAVAKFNRQLRRSSFVKPRSSPENPVIFLWSCPWMMKWAI